MQPENTWILDLGKSEDELLSGMSSRCRYNIKLAEKSGVKVHSNESDRKMLNTFFDLFSTTAKRHKISYRGADYFSNFLDILGKAGYARIYSATLLQEEGKEINLTSGICVYSRDKAIYMFGASSDELRNLKAPNLLVWRMIADAKAAGKKEFDFYGIAPNDDPKHPWAGITSFKKQFGGCQIDIIGSYDLIFKSAEYTAFKMLEKMRRHY